MNDRESLVEWLHGHPSHAIVIRAAGYFGEDGEWHPNENAATFTLTTSLPDGRKVQSAVTIPAELMTEPAAGEWIVREARTAIECLLAKR